MAQQIIETFSRRGCTVTKRIKVINVIKDIETYKVSYPFKKQYAELIPDVVTNIKGRYYIVGEFITAHEAHEFIIECMTLRQQFQTKNFN